jgi:hypothetical protein
MFQEYYTSRQVRGETRSKLGEKHQFQRPGKVLLDELGSVPNMRYFHMNFPTQSCEVYQTIKSEASLKGLDRTEKDMHDIK